MTEAQEPERPRSANPAGRWIRFAIAVLLVGALVYLGRRYLGELGRLKDASPWWTAGMVIVFLITRLFGSEITRMALIALGHRLDRWEVFAVTMTRAYTNLLIPRSGFGAAGAYLKVRHGVRFAEFGSLVLPLAVMELVVIGVAGLIGLGWWTLLHGSAWPLWIAAIFAVTTGGGIVTLLIRLPVNEGASSRLGKFLSDLGRAWRRLGDRGFLLRVAGVQIVVLLLRVLRLWMAFQAIGVSTNMAGLVIASALADLAFIVGLTPAGLGLREAAIVQIATFTDVSGGLAMTAALLDRLVTTLAVIVAAQFALRKMLRDDH